MAGRITVQTTGFKEADMIFQKLPLKVKEKELRKGHRSAGRLLVKAEREGFQRVAKNRTGATERGIGMVNERNKRGEIGVIAIGPIRRRNAERSAWKAPFFEGGTVSKSGTIKMTARPFIGPAVRRTQRAMRKVVGDKLALSLNRTIKRFRKAN